MNSGTGDVAAPQAGAKPEAIVVAPPVDYHDLEKIADTAIAFGRLLMECGASVSIIQEGASRVARGLGARPIGLRTGYASLTLTVSGGGHRVTRMRPVGRHLVNHRLESAVRALASAIEAERPGSHGWETARARLDALCEQTPRHSAMIVALGTGMACAAFGRLLGIDWAAFLPVWIGGALGQYARHRLLHRGVNLFVTAALVALIAAALGGIGARVMGSHTYAMASIAATLLLVPGVPAINAQTDIIDGYPTVGSARAVSVAMLMIFAACGIWFAEALHHLLTKAAGG